MRKNNTPFNILYSYANLNQRFAERLFADSEQGKVNVMIDSGAFSNFYSYGRKVELKEYCDWLKTAEPFIEKAVMLDVIGDFKATHNNYDKMLDMGLHPMFTVTTYEKDYDYVRKAIEYNPNICIAGGVKMKGDWMTRRILKLSEETDGKARIHALGYVVATMFSLPIVSVDCSSYSITARFGWLMYWGDYKVDKLWYKDLRAGRKQLDERAIAALEEVGVTPEQFWNPDNNKGALSICRYCALIAYLRYQVFVKFHGLDFFLAVGGEGDYADMCWINDNMHDLSYSRFVKEKKLSKK